MSRHGGRREGAGRPPLIEPALAERIGQFAEVMREKISDELRTERFHEANTFSARLNEAWDAIDARRKAGRLSHAQAITERQRAAETIIGNRKVFGRSPRLIRLPQPRYSVFNKQEQKESGETLLGLVYRLCREKYETPLQQALGAHFRLTDAHIRRCRRAYIQMLNTISEDET